MRYYTVSLLKMHLSSYYFNLKMSQCCNISYCFRDTAGTEKYRSLFTSYYKGAHGVFIVYDITSVKSFLALSKWIDDILNVSN